MFGPCILSFGPFIVHSLRRHLLRLASTPVEVQAHGAAPALTPPTYEEVRYFPETEASESKGKKLLARMRGTGTVCETWYSKHDGYIFTYDGPVDTEQYSMEFALGLLPLTLPDESGRLSLRDPAQGPMLDEALALTQPSKKKGSTRTRGEEVLAERAKRARQTAPPEGQQQVQPTEVARAPSKRRATHAPGMR
jgi:hypothetical protein